MLQSYIPLNLSKTLNSANNGVKIKVNFCFTLIFHGTSFVIHDDLVTVQLLKRQWQSDFLWQWPKKVEQWDEDDDYCYYLVRFTVHFVIISGPFSHNGQLSNALGIIFQAPATMLSRNDAMRALLLRLSKWDIGTRRVINIWNIFPIFVKMLLSQKIYLK